MGSFTILHISDVHFGVKDSKQEQQRITDALITAAHDESNPAPDICIFSGDLTQKGDDKDFSRGEEWLKELVEKWHLCPIFIVPGNHEVQRDNADEFIIRGAHHTEDYFQKWRNRKEGLKHLERFFKWHNNVKSSVLPLISNWDESKLVCSSTENIRNGKIRLLGLNTASLSCDDKDEGKLVVDIGLINKSLQDVDHNNELVIAVGHHPLDSLAPWNKKEIHTLFSQTKGIHVYIHGHLHTELVNSHSEYGQNLTTLGAGASYQGSKYPQSFAFYEFDFQEQKINPRTFCYDHKQGLWRLNTEHSYPITANLPHVNFSELEEVTKPVLTSNDNSERNITNELKSSKVQNDIYMVISRDTNIVNYKDDLWFSKALNDSISSSDRNEIQIISYSPVGFINIAEYLLNIIQPHNRTHPILSKGIVTKVRVFCSDGTDKLETFKSLYKIIQNNIPNVPYSKVFNEPGYFSFCLSIKFKNHTDTDTSSHPPTDIYVISAFEYLWKGMSHALHNDVQKGYLETNGFSRKLKFLKRLIDSCNEYLGDIHEKRLPTATQISPMESLKNRPLASSKQILTKLKGTIPDEHYSKLESAYKTRDQGEMIEGTIESGNRFVAAAKEFSSLLILACDFINDSNVAGRELEYWAKMEQAYCLLKSDMDENIVRAENIYKSILENNKNDVVALYRSAQILLKCNGFQESINMFKNGIQILDNGEDERIKNGHWLQEGQIERQLAIVYWLLSEECSETEDTLENVHLAITYTQRALDKNTGRDDRRFILNDLVYYGWLERNISSDNASHSLLDHEMNALVNEFKESIDMDNVQFYQPIDTLCRVFDARGEKDCAVKAAKRVRKILSERANGDARKNLKPHELSAYLFSADVLIN